MNDIEKLRRALEAAKMARTRLDRFADEANAGRVHYDARELKRKIGAAFTDFDEALAATQEQRGKPGREEVEQIAAKLMNEFDMRFGHGATKCRNVAREIASLRSAPSVSGGESDQDKRVRQHAATVSSSERDAL